MFHYNFRVGLFRSELEYFYFDLYAKNNFSAFQALFKELGPLRYFVVSVSIVRPLSSPGIFGEDE